MCQPGGILPGVHSRQKLIVRSSRERRESRLPKLPLLLGPFAPPCLLLACTLLADCQRLAGGGWRSQEGSAGFFGAYVKHSSVASHRPICIAIATKSSVSILCAAESFICDCKKQRASLWILCGFHSPGRAPSKLKPKKCSLNAAIRCASA